MKSISNIILKFIARIRGFDTSIQEPYFRIPKDLFYEAIDDLKGELTDLFIANK